MHSDLQSLFKARKSTRDFLDTPVKQSDIEAILTTASQAASSSNMQPWQVFVLAGDTKEKLSQAAIQQAMTTPQGAGSDLPIYPNPLPEPWYSRRQACGEKLYETLEISRDDKLGRMKQAGKNLTFFGAPVGLIFTMDRNLCESQLIDIGIFAQSIMLLAQERGLATCPQASWTMWADVIRQQLSLSDNHMVVLGMALGYPSDATINNLSQPRLTVNEFATFKGF